MESTNLISLLEQLDDHVDDLEEVLAPVLESTVLETSKKLPVMDKAKFHVMITYALESLIYSYLRLRGVEAKEHPVFRELTRIRQYNEKIKSLEAEPEKRSMVLDKQAANRFIKHGLAGNDKFDLQREEQLAKEKARAQLMASRLAKKANPTPEGSTKPASSDLDADANRNTNLDRDGDADEAQITEKAEPSRLTEKSRKSKKNKAKSTDDKGDRKKKRKTGSKEERRARRQERRKKKEESRNSRKAT
ncbi:Sas10/Utp3/C1D family-domain-containing protein [Aspergillus karnatakaensis]|uniref:Sas10/Utp3/C1D family protein n=1 Tax=Aspergillus karnatakaensis TaxID=1810916 RepID=UPI003CCD3B0A